MEDGRENEEWKIEPPPNKNSEEKKEQELEPEVRQQEPAGRLPRDLRYQERWHLPTWKRRLNSGAISAMSAGPPAPVCCTSPFMMLQYSNQVTCWKSR